MVVRAHRGEMGTLLRTFDQPKGLAMKPAGPFSLGTRTQVWEFRNAPVIAPQIEPASQCDACYLPRRCHVTDDILGHEMAGSAGTYRSSTPCSPACARWTRLQLHPALAPLVRNAPGAGGSLSHQRPGRHGPTPGCRRYDWPAAHGRLITRVCARAGVPRPVGLCRPVKDPKRG
jgi:Domain of unknown function (DUF4915)